MEIISLSEKRYIWKKKLLIRHNLFFWGEDLLPDKVAVHAEVHLLFPIMLGGLINSVVDKAYFFLLGY